MANPFTLTLTSPDGSELAVEDFENGGELRLTAAEEDRRGLVAVDLDLDQQRLLRDYLTANILAWATDDEPAMPRDTDEAEAER